MATYDLTNTNDIITVVNLIPDSSFENNQWYDTNNNSAYSTIEKKFNSRSLYFATGTTIVANIEIARPIVGHKYYGRRYIKTNGENKPADCRFEVWGADGENKNWVYAWNQGDYPEWHLDSTIYEIASVDYPETDRTIIRCFNVNTTADTWVDGLMLIDLTACFGTGNEPTKEWCDTYIPYFDGEHIILKNKLKKEDIINCPYSGNVKAITLPKGLYKLECWGAQGGDYSTTYTGGRGGFSSGILNLTEKTTVYLYAGGDGQKTTAASILSAGGFNGGGKATTSNASYHTCGGGGGTDIRIGTDSLYARVIVAGGGGGAMGAAAGQGNGGYGGGTSGGAGASASSSYTTGKGGTQTAVGASYYGTAAATTTNSDLGGFGKGASAKTSSSYSTGGGGGWYGGGSARRAGSGGGSGYVYTSSTASSYPSGCLLTADNYLTEASTTAGNVAFLSPNGVSETGHSGNGYVRITVIEIKTLNMYLGSLNIVDAYLGDILLTDCILN